MKQKTLLLFLLIILLSKINSQQILNTKDQSGLNILFTFGSCFSERSSKLKDISIFKYISKIEPDIFAWLGDASYSKNYETAVESFNFTKNEIGYKMLQQNNQTQIIGIWDDHDYGKNDGDKYYKYKNEMRQIYLDFLDEPQNSIRRQQSGGIYTSYYLGNTKQIKLILLDVRFSRDSFWMEHQDILGDAQWKWLENEFEDMNSNILIIGGGCQFIPDDRVIPEKWYPESRDRLFHLIEKHQKTKRVILLSGDVHFAEILEEPDSVQRFGYNLVEITSSGLTHSVYETFYHQSIIDSFLTNTFNEKRDRYQGQNYAKMDIKIDENNKENTTIELKIQDQNDKTQLQIMLQPWKKNQNQLKLSNSQFNRNDHRYIRWIYWVLQNYFVTYKKIGISLAILAIVGVVGIVIFIKKNKQLNFEKNNKLKEI